MAITIAQINAAKYFPELLPDAQTIANIAANTEAVPAVLDTRQFPPRFLRLGSLATAQNANLWVRIKADTEEIQISAASLQNQLPNIYDMLAVNWLRLNLFATAGLASMPIFYNLWVTKPTIAAKIMLGHILTNEEREIAERLGLHDTVEKGLLPMPFSYLIEREYRVIYDETLGYQVFPTAAISDVAEIAARENELLILRHISSQPATTVQNVRVSVDRDDDANYVNLLQVFPLSRATEVECFIPAIDRLRFTTVAAVAPGAHQLRFRIQRVMMSNILRVRFGLVARGEVPNDLYDKVLAGVV